MLGCILYHRPQAVLLRSVLVSAVCGSTFAGRDLELGASLARLGAWPLLGFRVLGLGILPSGLEANWSLRVLGLGIGEFRLFGRRALGAFLGA